MERRLPREYSGWQEHEPAFRRMTTPELVQEIQDGSPERRLAALSVIDLADVAPSTIEDWIRTLPDAEANELAGAIPAQRPHSVCAEDVRWVGVARLGYEQRRLPTFLVMLFSSLEALDSRACAEAAGEWERIGDWLGDVYDRVVAAGEEDARGDISLFVFENYLGQPAIFEAFCGMMVRHEVLALEVSANPALYLLQVDEAHQRFALQEAAANGGIPFDQAWKTLQGG
ncbi:hypothetical protein [Candidatus Amarobacter glycogenicus]|uniref:hypothetical protein n=1 Tax=Candidatus Amarobacter glycogenicus TaxID=3140699 RepID=UPI002A0FD5D1|nr:hypothetical protein [Dehalococcoidia bacterium]MBK9611879.1 hypothetical protein [Dehalococcoidia bacterium]